MVELDVTHPASIALGALLGAGALWALLARSAPSRVRRAREEDALRAELEVAADIGRHRRLAPGSGDAPGHL